MRGHPAHPEVWGEGAGDANTPGTATARALHEINPPREGIWAPQPVPGWHPAAGARRCCRSNKIARSCFRGEEDAGSPSSRAAVRTCPRIGPAWLGPSLTRTRPFYPRLREGTGMEGSGEDVSRGRASPSPGPGGEGWVALEFRLLRYH